MGKISLVGNRILVIPEEVESMSKGGLYIPDASKDKPKQGVVVSCGPDVNNVLVEDTVMYGKYAYVESSKSN